MIAAIAIAIALSLPVGLLLAVWGLDIAVDRGWL